jgi:small nuclear ribonucleoprotein (snRNP)-like protein
MDAEMKNKSELKNCKEGKQITLNFKNDECYTGLFRGFDGDFTIMLEGLITKKMIGLPFDKLDDYIEEV